MTEKSRKIISYVVPSYNHEKYVLALLESIKLDIGDLCESAEIIIIDDGSRDTSPVIINQWVKANKDHIQITFIALSENEGIPAVFNKLVDLSNGIFLRFAGSDDLLVQGSTRKLLDSFLGRPSAFCSFGDAVVIDGNDRIIHTSSIEYHGGTRAKLSDVNTLKRELIQNWCLAGPSFLIRKSHYDVMKYDESLKIDDYDLYLSLLERPDAVVFLNTIVCRYRIHDSNTSKTKNNQKRIDNLQSFLKIIDRYIKKDTLTNDLIPVKYKTIAKINFLKCSYLVSIVYLIYYGISKVKCWLTK